MVVGEFFFLSIPYSDIVTIRDEIAYLWKALPKSFTFSEAFELSRNILPEYNSANIKLIISKFEAVGLVKPYKKKWK